MGIQTLGVTLGISFLDITKRNEFRHPHKGKEMTIHSTLIHKAKTIGTVSFHLWENRYVHCSYYLAMKRKKLWTLAKT